MKTKLETNIDGYPLKLASSFKSAYSNDANLISIAEIPIKSLVRILAYFLFFRQKVILRAKIVYLHLLIKHDWKGV